MSCNPAGLSELPGGPSVTTGIIVIRECLKVQGVDVDGIVHHDATLTGTGQVASPLSVVAGGAAVFSDGVTLQGDGTIGSKLAIKAVQHDGTLTGNGTVASPLSVPAGPPATVQTDGVTLQGDGSGGDKVRIKQVQATGMTGAGTVASPLNCQTISGAGGQVDAGTPSLITMTTVDPGNIAIQAQDAGHTGAGGLALTAQGGGGSLGATLGTVSGGPVRLGAVGGDVVQMFPGFFDVKALAASPGVSPAGYARFWYDSTAGVVKVSINGAAFVAVVTL